MNRKPNYAGLIVVALLVYFLRSEMLPSSPVPGVGLHVMVIEDKSPEGRKALTAEQFDSLYSVDLDNQIKAAGGKKFVVGHTQDMASESDEWAKRAFAVPRTTVPWVVIDRDGRGEAGPMKDLRVQVGKYLK